jgi:hypothetical protein
MPQRKIQKKKKKKRNRVQLQMVLLCFCKVILGFFSPLPDIFTSPHQSDSSIC